MPASSLLIYRMIASKAQIRVTFGAALAFFLLFLVAIFFRSELFQTQKMPARDVFSAVSGAILMMADWIIALLLFAQARILHARPLYVLVAGFFFAGLFMGLRVLSLPGALAALDRRFDPTYDLPLWFYCFSHAALPLAILPYVWLSRATDRRLRTNPAPHPALGHYLAGSMILAASVSLVLVFGKTSPHWSSPAFLSASAVIVLIIIGMAALEHALRSELNLKLLLMLWGWFLEVTLIALPYAGYTPGWYAARSLGLVSGLFVLFALLAETNKLYAQSVLQLIAQEQEREHRFLIRDATSATIAHELRQPLGAIMINAEVARKITSDQRREAAPDQAIQVLDDIIASSHRANDMLESKRAIFRRQSGEKIFVDPVVILQSTLAMIENSARAHNVSVELVVEQRPRPVAVNRLQLQQALLNLLQNAIEALSRSHQRRRVLVVRCRRWEDRGVIIRVEDNGPGIAAADRNRVFDAFYTTRPEAAGMGLLIARSVIRAHGGTIHAAPREPFGAVFEICLPTGDGIAPPPAMPAGTAAFVTSS
jgi:signal transduction histidine kinase